jgi:hypothetical protein
MDRYPSECMHFYTWPLVRTARMSPTLDAVLPALGTIVMILAFLAWLLGAYHQFKFMEE